MKNNQPNQNTTKDNGIHKDADKTKTIGVIAALAVAGSILLALAMGLLPFNKAHANDAATDAAVTQVEGAVDAAGQATGQAYVDPATAGAVTDEVSKGGTCTITLPEGSPWLDRVKATFKEAGCAVGVYKLENGDVNVEVVEPHTADVPAPTGDTK